MQHSHIWVVFLFDELLLVSWQLLGWRNLMTEVPSRIETVQGGVLLVFIPLLRLSESKRRLLCLLESGLGKKPFLLINLFQGGADVGRETWVGVIVEDELIAGHLEGLFLRELIGVRRRVHVICLDWVVKRALRPFLIKAFRCVLNRGEKFLLGSHSKRRLIKRGLPIYPQESVLDPVSVGRGDPPQILDQGRSLQFSIHLG